MITTGYLYLRELQTADCSDDYVAWLKDPQVIQFLETRHTEQCLRAIQAFVEHVAARDDEFLFGIFLASSDKHIGNIKIGPIKQVHRVADISLFIGDRACWGKGYATEAIAAVSRHAFAHYGIHKLNATMYAANIGSTKAFLQAGYRQEGLRREHYDLDGVRSDIIELGLLPGDIA